MKLNLAKITQRYVGAPYKLGGKSVKEGFDCFSLLYTVATKEYGLKVPSQINGYNFDNYTLLWLENKREAMQVFVRYLSSFMKRINPGFNKAGDILVLRGENITIGMQTGTDMVFSAFTDIGVNLNSIRNYEIVRTYRWEM